MHPDEVPVDDALVRALLRALLREQFPHWADEPLLRIVDAGTDNAIYRLGETMGVRLPRIHWAEAQIDKECQWVGRLAAGLPLPVPVPLAQGRPGHGYPFPWLVYPAGRTFREAVAFEDNTWARARGWVVEKTILYIPYYGRTLPVAVEQAKQRLQAALGDA
jgi:aminoglycoside phosphotransferase (APT) family kinase protein